MKKILMLLVILGATVFTSQELMAQTGDKKVTRQEEQKKIQERFDKLGRDIKAQTAVAEDNLKKANDKTKAEAQKAVDDLKKAAKEVEDGTKKAGEDVKDNWEVVKKELNDLADRIERKVKK